MRLRRNLHRHGADAARRPGAVLHNHLTGKARAEPIRHQPCEAAAAGHERKGDPHQLIDKLRGARAAIAGMTVAGAVSGQVTRRCRRIRSTCRELGAERRCAVSAAAPVP